MSGRERSDPFGRHRFTVDLGTGDPLGFTTVRGLSVSVEIRPDDVTDESEHDEDTPWWELSDWLDQPRESLPAPTRRRTVSPTIELQRGLTADTTLWDWLQEWVAGTTKPRDVHIVLLDNSERPVRGWRCLGATPVEWSGPELVATRSEVATETLELAHEGIDHVSDLSRWATE